MAVLEVELSKRPTTPPVYVAEEVIVALLVHPETLAAPLTIPAMPPTQDVLVVPVFSIVPETVKSLIDALPFT